MTSEPRPMSWLSIIAITAATAVVTGVTIGLVRETLGLPHGLATASVGAATGVVGAVLVTRRRAASRGHHST